MRLLVEVILIFMFKCGKGLMERFLEKEEMVVEGFELNRRLW